jgi:hypothetical protein
VEIAIKPGYHGFSRSRRYLLLATCIVLFVVTSSQALALPLKRVTSYACAEIHHPALLDSAHVSPRPAANFKLTGISAVSSVTAVRNQLSQTPWLNRYPRESTGTSKSHQCLALICRVFRFFDQVGVRAASPICWSRVPHTRR